MKKGISEIYVIVITLVLAFLAIVVIWYFHEKIFGWFSSILLKGLEAFIRYIVCDVIPVLSWFC